MAQPQTRATVTKNDANEYIYTSLPQPTYLNQTISPSECRVEMYIYNRVDRYVKPSIIFTFLVLCCALRNVICSFYFEFRGLAFCYKKIIYQTGPP